MKKFWSLCSLCVILVILVTEPGIGQKMTGMGRYHPMPYPYRGEDRKWGYTNSSGIQVVHPQYDLAGPFQEGLASVKKGNKWGYINDKGMEVIPLKFEVAAPFSEGLAAVKKNGKWGYIDTKGKRIIDYKYDIADNFSEGIAGIEIGGKWGYIDASGKEVIAPQFNLANPFTERLASVETAGKWGYINKTGMFVIPAQYDIAHPFSEGLASVLIWHENPWEPRFALNSAFIDKSGKHVLTCYNATAGSFHGGKAQLISDNRTYLINKRGDKMQIEQHRVNVQLDSDPELTTFGSTVWTVDL